MLARLANEADAFVWCTPAYHNSFSGVLKNALDHLHRDQFRQKPVALISHDRERSARVSNQLRDVADGLLAMPTPTHIVTIDKDFILIEDDYKLVNRSIERLLIHMADELVEYSRPKRRRRTLSEDYNVLPPGAIQLS